MEVATPVARYRDFLRAHSLADRRSSLVVFQVHEDLRLTRGWSGLQVVNGEMTYLVGTAALGFDSVFPGTVDAEVDRTQAVVPMATDLPLTPRILSDLCAGVVHPVTRGPLRCVTVAIVDRDSTTAYYRVFEKFDEIVHTQWKQKRPRTAGGEGGGGGDEDEDAADAGATSDDSGSAASASDDSDSDG